MPTRTPDDRSGIPSEAFAGSGPRRLAFGLLLAFVAAAPFPWGSVQPGFSGTGKVIAGAFLIALLTAISRDVRLRLGDARLPVAAVSGIGVLGLVQLLPLPAGVVRAVSPASAEAWDGAGRVLGAFGRPAPAVRITLMPWETAGVALFAFALVALFLASAALLRTRASRRLFGVVVLASALVQVGVAVAGEDRATRLHGSFVNPNNFAGYLEIGLAFALGLLWYRARTGIRELSETTGAEERADRLYRLLPRTATAVVAFGVIAAGIVVSQSRGGLLAACGGPLLLGALALQLRREASRRSRAAFATLVILVALGTAFAIAGAGTVAFLRFLMPDAADLGADYRILIWRDSLSAFRLFPWLGSGLGTFREALRRVQSPGVPGLVDQAHDELLQLLVTGGVVGAALGLIALALGVRALLTALYRQRHREESAYGLAGFGALAMLLLHGVAEFNFSIPAIPATLAACLGAAWAALGWRRSDEAEDGASAAVTGPGAAPERPRRRSAPPSG